jgi:hypothetical protein
MSILLLLVFGSCQKQPPKQQLPKISNTGKHTLGFLLNGESWIPYDRGYHEEFELPMAELSADGSLKISATRIDDSNYARNWFCLEINKGCFSPGRYPVSNHFCTAPYQTYFYGKNKNNPSETFEIDSRTPHFIEVETLDTIRYIVSGTFQFDAISNLGNKIKVRSGRFDLILKKIDFD